MKKTLFIFFLFFPLAACSQTWSNNLNTKRFNIAGDSGKDFVNYLTWLADTGSSARVIQTWPNNNGAGGAVYLKNDGTGHLSWVPISADSARIAGTSIYADTSLNSTLTYSVNLGSGTYNDYAPVHNNFYYSNNGSNAVFTGIIPDKKNGYLLSFYTRQLTGSVVFRNENTNSKQADRIITPNGGDFYILQGQNALLVYDTNYDAVESPDTLGRWIVASVYPPDTVATDTNRFILNQITSVQPAGFRISSNGIAGNFIADTVLEVGTPGGAPGVIEIDSGLNSTNLRARDSLSFDMILPPGPGSNHQVLQTDGGSPAKLTWTTISSTFADSSRASHISDTAKYAYRSDTSIHAVGSISFGTTGLTPNTATQGAVTVAGTLTEANGGTHQSSYATGDLLYASGTNALSKLAIGTASYVLTVSGGVPVWAAPANVSTIANSIYINGIHRTPTLALLLADTTAATSSLPSYSPYLNFRGELNPSGSLSQEADIRMYDSTSVGNSSNYFEIENSVNGGSYTNVLNYQSQTAGNGNPELFTLGGSGNGVKLVLYQTGQANCIISAGSTAGYPGALQFISSIGSSTRGGGGFTWQTNHSGTTTPGNVFTIGLKAVATNSTDSAIFTFGNSFFPEVVITKSVITGSNAGITIPFGTVVEIDHGTETGAFAITIPAGVEGQLLWIFNNTSFATTGTVIASGAIGRFIYLASAWRAA